MIEEFITENIERDINVFTENHELYKRYEMFCKEKGIKSFTLREFNFRFKKFGIGIKHRKIVNYQYLYGWQGVRLKPCPY